MSFKHFLGMATEEAVIDSSSLTKFRKLRLKSLNLLDMLINKTVEIEIDKGVIKSKTIIVDATTDGVSGKRVLQNKGKGTLQD